MNIEKVKEAKNYLYDGISCILRGVPVRDLDERIYALEAVLAELEKPAEDDVIILSEKCLTIYEHESTEASCVRRISSLFQQYAESYHAKKCAECVEKFTCETCGNKEPNGCNGCYLSDVNITNNWKPHA